MSVLNHRILILLVLAAFNGCSHNKPIAESSNDQQSEPSATPLPSASPSVGGVTFVPLKDYTTEAEKAYVAKVAVKMNETGYNQCTYNFIKNRNMIQTNGKTPLQVADHLMSLKGSINVGFYYSWFTSARAYRDGDNIWLNRKFIGVDSDLCETASTFDHEGRGHALGLYDHDFNWSPSREYSVPYSIDHAYFTNSYSQSPSGGCCK